MANLSPMMQQYFAIKEAHKDHILFFRLGDFYEMFFDDALLASKELELTLTGRDCGLEERAPMCGVPYHSSEAYIQRLLEKGYKVAICEQTELPQKGKALVNNIFVLGMSIPSVMLVMPLFKMATSLGLIGSRWTLMILYICVNVPFGVFFLSGFFLSLPKALEEAAEIDGCTPSKAFWKIMFPLAQPGIVTLTIFNFITIWNEYFMALIFANKTELRTVSTGLQAIVQSMKYSGDWAGLFAGVIIVFLPTFILYIFLSNKIIAGVTGGAVKE